MPEATKQVIKSRSASHSDVADSPAARAHQQALAERQFGAELLRRVRESKGMLKLRNLQEEWISSNDGMVYEISVEAEDIEE